MARQHTIEVTVEQGKLKYEISTDGGPKKPGKQAHVRHNDTVQWISPSGAFACLLKRTPFVETALAAPANQTTLPATVTAKHLKAGNNSYEYFAAVVVQGKAISEDPEIIIDEDPG
jgi:hypothetical protein